MTYDRPGCYEIPSHELALHFARRGKVVDATLAPAPPSGGKASQRMAVAAAAPAEGVITLFAKDCPLGCGCTVCVNYCRWCAEPLHPLTPDEVDAVVRRLGRLCEACAEGQEGVR